MGADTTSHHSDDNHKLHHSGDKTDHRDGGDKPHHRDGGDKPKPPPDVARRSFLAQGAALGAVAAGAMSIATRAGAQPPSDVWLPPHAPDASVDANAEGVAPTPGSRTELQRVIDAVAADGGGDVALMEAGDYGLAAPLNIGANIRVFLGGGVRLIPSTSMPNLVAFAPDASRSALIGGELDGANALGSSVIAIGQNFSDIKISTRIRNSGADASSTTNGIVAATGSRLSIVDTDLENVFVAIQIGDAVTDLVVRGCRVAELNNQGNLVQLFGEINRAWIDENVSLGHRSDAIGGHHIQFSGEAQGHTHRDVWITNNYLEGLPQAYQVVDDEPVPNGGSGDMIACRSLDGFTVASNVLRNSGEYGITVVHGSRNGIVRDNIVVDADGSGIICGTPNNSIVHNITVCDNTIIAPGRDRAGELGRIAKAAIRFWNAKNCACVNNLVVDYPQNGLYIHAPAPPDEATVTNFYHAQNRYNPAEGNGEEPIWDVDTDWGGTGEQNWTEGVVI